MMVAVLLILIGNPWPAFVSASNQCDSPQDIKASVEEGWIVASKGTDESRQHLRVELASPWLRDSGFTQLDDDPEEEFFVVSRQRGTGPYYALQIVDFRCHGTKVWQYPSAGHPRIEAGLVHLGFLPDGYRGASTEPEFRTFQFGPDGLEMREK